MQQYKYTLNTHETDKCPPKMGAILVKLLRLNFQYFIYIYI